MSICISIESSVLLFRLVFLFFSSAILYIFLFSHCVSLLLHVHCLPICSIVLFGLISTRLNKYYYYYYYYHYYYYCYYYYCSLAQMA